MPEFDKDLQPVLLRKEESLPDLPNPSTPYPDDNGPVPRFGSLDAGVRPGRKKSALENFFGSGPIVSEMLPTVSVKELSANQRYSNYSPFIVDSESTHAETQSGWDKAANGILKFAGIAGTTVLGLGGLVYGAGKSAFTQKLSDIWDNEIMNGLDEINTTLDQKYLPNYYSRQETNARWYSPDNWMTWNFLFDKVVKNGGYVAGAILSGNIVSGVVKVAGASIGARLLSAATAAEASQAFKIFTPLLRNSARAMSLGANAEVEAAMIKDISSIADVTKRASELNNIIKTTSSFAKFNDQGRRVITAAFANAGEASFEALHAGKAFREKLINEYKEANDGIEPDEKALKEIDAKVAKVGKASFLGNLAILGITEYFQLPRLMGSSYAAERSAANSLIRSTSDIAMKDAKYVVKTPTTRFGKFLKTADKLTAIRRYVADPKEGVQEILQYGLDVGVQNYFEKAFKTGDADIWSDGFLYGLFGRDEMGKGEGALVSKEGIEGGVIGALTGGVMSAGRTYSERKALESNTNNFIKALNSVPSFKQAFQDRLNSANRGLYLMAERDGAVLLNDKLEAMDINADMMYNYLSTRIKYGRYDMVMEDLAEFRQLGSTEEGLASLKEQGYANLNDTIESYSLRLSGMEQQAKTINDLYESMGTTYGGQILTDKDGKPILDAKGNQQLKYTPQILDRMVYAATKIADYDNRIPKLNEALSRLLTSDITSYSKNNATVQDIVNEELTNPESDILETTINNIKSSGELLQDDAIQTLVDIVELSQRRKKFLSEYNEILENPQNVRINGKEIGEMGDEISDEDRGKTIQIKTRAGVRDYEIGEEYFLGQVVKYDKDGNEVILFPRLTLLGENEDGTIKIRDNKGVRNVSKEEFEGYKLGKVSAVRDNENASFYLRNVNNVVYWNTGKAKSGKIAGRLTYDYVNDTLYFTYKDKKGKIKSVEVSLDSFTAKEGFTEGVFSFGRTLSAEDQADINKRKETGKTQEDINRRKAVRLAFINNLYNSLVEKLGKTQNLIQQKYSEFEKITNELTALENKITGGELTRKSNFKRTTARAISAANRLSRMREQLLSEIRDLETQQEEIETTVSYLEELSTSLDELPTDSRDFLEELRQQVRDLESLTLETGQNINSISKIITSTEKALEYALNLVRDLISKFESTYPKVPTIMGQDWVDFLKANPNFLKLNPNFKEDLAMVEDIIAQVEDLDIVPNERTVAELREQMEKLQEQLSELDKELRAKSSILSVFEDAVKQYEQQKAEEETLLRTREIMTEVLGTKDNGPQTTEYSKTYEPESKKETSILPRATVASTGKPHHERANRFGINLGKFREAVRNKIRGVYITANNEDQLIPGLIDHLRTNSEGVVDPSIPRDKVIALVMVAQEEDGSLTLVDVNGEPLAANADKINSAIYQVYPEEKLEWDAKWSKSGKAESMFRKDVPEEVQAAVRKQYAAWRKATLEKTTLDPHEIAASFGIPSNVKKLDDQGNEKTDYDASTSVADAGLVTDEQLERDRHIEIAKNNDTVSEGTVSFKTPLGRVFLRIPGIGLVKLKNRRLTKTEVNTIYEAIYRLSQNMVDPKKGIKSDESKMLVSWLKSVIYWGTPRQPGYNSVWFDFDETTQRWMLNMSGKGKDFPFTPSSIKQNKAQIIEMLSLMYNNVNSTLATGKDYWNKPYYEIIGFDSDGKPITRTVNGKPYWPNYQTFLLSKQGRKPEELPLSTIMRPLKNEDDYNREGVYFYTTDNADEFPTSAPKPTVAAAPPAGPTVTPTVVAPGKPEVTATFDLSGEVTNSIDIIGKDGKNYGTVTFEVNGKELLETGGDKGLNNIKVTEGTVKALAEARGISIDDAKRIIPQYIVAKLGPQLQALQNEMNKKEEPTPAPVQPTAPTPTETYKGLQVIDNSSIKYDTGEPGAAKYDRVENKILVNRELLKKKFDEKAWTKPRKQIDGSFAKAFPENAFTTYEEFEKFVIEHEFQHSLLSYEQSGANNIGEYEDIINRKAFAEIAPTPAAPVAKEEVIEVKPTALISTKYNREDFPDYQPNTRTPATQKLLDYFAEVMGVPKYTEDLSKGEYPAWIESVGKSEGAEMLTSYIVGSLNNLKKAFDAIAEYEKERAALEEEEKALEAKSTKAPAAPTTPSTDPSTVGLTAEEDELMRQQGNKQITDDEEEALREIVKQEIEKFQPENWKEVEDFLRKNFPNIPVYRVKNIIQATNGRQAWGMLKNGAIYIYENAEVGTAYHEIFEAVWKHFSDPNEQRSILNEFKSRKGSFVDRVTGQEIKYKDATYQEAKEQLAEEFRDYVRNGTVPPKPGAGRPFILKLFYDIKNFIEEFFTGKKAKSNTEKLFEKIGSGYYKNYSPYHSTLAYAKKGVMDINDAYADGDSEFSLIGITGKQRHEIIEHMTYVMLTDMIKSDESLFKINEKLTRKEVYDKLKAEVQTVFSKKRTALENDILEGKYTAEQARPAIDRQIALWKNVTSQWDQLVKMHEDYLKIYSIEFDENDEVTMKSDERSKESGWHDANKIDTFRKANNAVKMLLATVPVTKVNEQGKTVPVKSSIGGNTLLPVSKVYISLMNNIHDAVSVEDMLNKIRKMAETDPNYRSVYKRLTKSDWSTPGINLSKIEKEHGLQLISAFWKTFKKQNPEVKNVFVLDNGDVVVGDASLSSAARQVQSEFEESIIGRIREGKTKYFKLSEDRKKYVGVPEQASKIKIGTIPERVEFLKGIGIDFNANDILRLSPNQIKTFKDATDGIARSIKEAEEIFTASGKILKLKGRLLELGVIKSAIENPEFESTFFNLNGERVQSFIGTNAATELFEFLSQLPEFTPEALQGTKFEYLLTDSFAKGSTILERMFKEAQRIKGSEGLLKPGYVDGFVNEQNGKRKESSKLNYRERLIQELNLNLAGYYLNLVPGDASMEHMMYMGNVISANDLRYGYDLIYDVFGGYFKSELELSREDRPIQKIKISEKQKKQGVQQRNSTDLRFFKTILGKELHDKIVKDKEPNIDKVYEKYKSQIDKAIKDYVSKQTSSFKKVLNDYNILKESEEGIIADGINLEDASLGMDEVFLDRNLEALTVNYMISNIEMHKLLYADPYQYSDELKRIKNFLSPRQAIISNSPEMNAALNAVWNKGYKPGDVGYTDMTKDEFVSVAINDIEGVIDIPNYDGFEETDGSGIMNYKAYRNFRIRSSDWNDNEELQYRYDVAWEKRDKSQGLTNEEIEKRGLKLSKEEMDILNAGNPGVRSAYTARKPIVAGNKNDGNLYNDPVLDKFAIYPLSYRVMKTLNPESNAVKLYNKMQAEGIDYVVFKSGRKVGATQTNDLYNEDGSFNTTPFKGQTNIPFSIISVQSEVPSKEDEIATRGSQVTKLVTMDFMESGVPIDFKDAKGKTDFSAKRYKEWMALSQEEKEAKSPLYKELMNNQKLLEALIDEGYNNLLKSMGIEEVNGEFKLVDKSKAGETLRREVLKREVNDNTIDALEGFLRGDVVLEATPAYQQIRNILYSIADREVVSQKISGGMKVQIPSTLLESVRAKKTTINGKTGYTSDVLKFYEDEDGKRVCEIMVGRWFDSSLSDEELIAYLNKPENQEILRGMAFRIPTQKQNSIDVFKIKQFLPREFGDNVVIPAALVKKVGSDFDIDKLTVYLKNVYENVNGELKAVPFFGYTRVEAKAKFDEMFDSGEFLNKKKLAELDRIIEEEKDNLREIEMDSASGKLISSIFKSAFSEEEITKDFINYIVKSTKQEVRDKIFDKLYKKSLENAYIKSGENLVSSRENFDKLIAPNSAKQLQDLAAKITEKLGLDQFDYSSTGNMLNRHFMSRLRHAFVTGKYAIGIAAVNQTSHSLNQRQPIYVDFSRLSNLSKQDVYWLTKGTGEAKDAEIKFKNYNRIEIDGKMVPTLSMIKNAVGQYISDINGQFIDGYVDISKGPWIMELGATPNVAGTWLFLVKLGVPIDTVAYFMNQPIIRDYLRSLENAGYSYVFNDTFVNLIKEDGKYALDEADSEARLAEMNEIPSEKALLENIGKKSFNNDEKAQQHFILGEFLKYAKMAEQAFYVTQGSNFDTATFNDPYLVFRKSMQFKKAQNTIISSVDEILENSFLGKLAERIFDFRNAYSTILRSDTPNVRNVMEKVLLPYVDMNDRDFVKVAQKAVADLFDWAVQNDRGFNKLVQEVLLEKTGVAGRMFDFVRSVKENPEHPLYNNHIINILEPVFSKKIEGGVNNLKIKGRDNKVYDQNNIIFAFRELKESIDEEMYKGLMNLAVLQSGIANSPISFTSLLPYEDFKELYNETLSKLETLPNLEGFYNLNVFERNNWNNDDIVPYMVAKFGKSKKEKWYYNLPMNTLPKNIKAAISNGEIPQMLNISAMSREATKDVIVYRWETKLSKSDKKKMREKGDYSYINKGLFKKVYDESGNPYIYESASDGKVYRNYVYKMINAWGDSFRANEFYDTIEVSKIDNGFIKVQEGETDVRIGDNTFKRNTAGETADAVILDYYINADKKNIKSVPLVPVSEAPTTAPISSAKVLEGDIFSLPGIPVITTNLGGVHGAGLAQAAKAKGLIKQGDGQFKFGPNVVQLPVKKVWSDSMSMNNNMDLLKDSLKKLQSVAYLNPDKTYLLPLAGLGHGEGKVSEIMPLLINVIKTSPNIKLVLPAPGVNLGRQGTVRKDETREKLPEIKAMLDKAGLRGTQISTANEASLRSQIAALEDKMRKTGLGPAESGQLTKLQNELGKLIKSSC